jgi:hypothetical protein
MIHVELEPYILRDIKTLILECQNKSRKTSAKFALVIINNFSRTERQKKGYQTEHDARKSYRFPS